MRGGGARGGRGERRGAEVAEKPIGPGEPRMSHAQLYGGLGPGPYGDHIGNRFHPLKQHGANAPLAVGAGGRAP
ncbi:hypothetical protein GCM10010284_08150 [Streptomyces rubiginosohelvolus]|uniref:Uncharacterized protein n=1 Tax=Streptomyces rubiginosohelvolus TaxID=67362 RepID=A0ABQ3C0E5_9ACTN|nr:hypothetical protein GCM10010284_08150 [Streptomyces rubiginosohelvolus]GGZ63401.1 hypothetical protein GCM10010328_42390 [Streptomyces pluricolorescens]